MPRVLMRLPYTADTQRVDGFCFVEDVAGPTHRNYLWGGAAFALGAVIMRAFENAEWPADIRGVQRGVDGGGLVTGLLVDEPGTDSRRVAYKFSTDVVITHERFTDPKRAESHESGWSQLLRLLSGAIEDTSV